MPEISRFMGIIIAMFYDEHSPPHFHARYQGMQAAVDIRTLEILEGKLPPRIRGLVTEWAALHQHELEDDWNLARENKPLLAIMPLE